LCCVFGIMDISVPQLSADGTLRETNVGFSIFVISFIVVDVLLLPLTCPCIYVCVCVCVLVFT